MKITVLGAGTWGTALALLLKNNGHSVALWSALSEEISELKASGRHKNLPGAALPDGIELTDDIAVALKNANIVLFVVPSSFIRKTAAAAARHIPDGAIILNAAKGIEPDTLKTMTEVIADELSVLAPALKYEIAALSGPTHAEEVAIGLPTSIVAACEKEEIGRTIAAVFANSCMRVYTNTDVLGVELCGALKNIIALAAGINRGMGFGDNSGAMLMTRGAAEITRLGLAMGCEERTFMGLAGIGDLIVTCTSRHSRNNRCGELIGSGKSYEEAAGEIGMVVEGYHALDAAISLARRYNVEMPITEAVNDVIKNNRSTREAMVSLMTRELKSELQK